MNKDYDVNIVIPTYNGSKYILETLKSCVEQDYSNLKIIVIDDFSSDDTANIVERYIIDSGFSNVFLIRNEKNLGLPKSINKGVRYSKSDYFIYLGHDDLLPRKHVSNLLSMLEGNESLVHCNSIVIDKNGVKKKLVKDDEAQKHKTENINFELAIENFISVVGMLHNTKKFLEVNGWDEKYDLFGEWLYYTKMMTVGKVKYTTITRAYYRKHDSNVTHSLYSSKRRWSFYNYRKKSRKSAYKTRKFSVTEKLMYHKQSVREILVFIKASYMK